jgi:acyl-CoA reductase-like NAD-dependent aldehyde dehydrogenase
MARIDVPEWIPRVGMAGEAELPALGEQPVVSPYDRDEIARVAVSGEDAVDAAVAVALAAMGTAPIAAERARVLDRAAGIVEERAEVLADQRMPCGVNTA